MRTPSDEDQELVLAYLFTQYPAAVTAREIGGALGWGTGRLYSTVMFVEGRNLALSEWSPPEPRLSHPRQRVYWLNPALVPRLRRTIQERMGVLGQSRVL